MWGQGYSRYTEWPRVGQYYVVLHAVYFWHVFADWLICLIKLKPRIGVIYKTIPVFPTHLAKWQVFVFFLIENKNMTRSVVYKHRFCIYDSPEAF